MSAVLFLENSAHGAGGVAEKYDLDATAARRIAELEREFQVSQSDLRSTIQRLETVNGELQAANEELLTANEELQSSTEELQSVNEELYTVNTEHQLKLDELTMMTNDLSNFLSSTMIGILFVDSNLEHPQIYRICRAGISADGARHWQVHSDLRPQFSRRSH